MFRATMCPSSGADECVCYSLVLVCAVAAPTRCHFFLSTPISTYTGPFIQGRYTDTKTFVHIRIGLVRTVHLSNDLPSYHSIHTSSHLSLNKLVTPTTNSSIKPITSPFGDEKELFDWTDVYITHAGRIELLETREDQTDLLASLADRTTYWLLTQVGGNYRRTVTLD